MLRVACRPPHGLAPSCHANLKSILYTPLHFCLKHWIAARKLHHISSQSKPPMLKIPKVLRRHTWCGRGGFWGAGSAKTPTFRAEIGSSTTTTKCETYNTHPRPLLHWCIILLRSQLSQPKPLQEADTLAPPPQSPNPTQPPAMNLPLSLPGQCGRSMHQQHQVTYEERKSRRRRRRHYTELPLWAWKHTALHCWWCYC